MYVFSARPFENHLCERLPCLKIINNNNNNNNNNVNKSHLPLGEFIRAKRKTSLGNIWLVSEKIRREKVGSVPTFSLFARTNSPSGKWA
jgi:hypothetical protein